MARKMTKDIRYMVEKANRTFSSPYMRMEEHRAEREALAGFISSVLLDRNMYHGFNYYEEREITLKDGTKELVKSCAGKETGFIQFYIV